MEVVVALFAMSMNVAFAEVLETDECRMLEGYGLGEIELSNGEETSVLVIILLLVIMSSKELFKTTSSAISEIDKVNGIIIVNNYYTF